jgi:hypothetical protein
MRRPLKEKERPVQALPPRPPLRWLRRQRAERGGAEEKVERVEGRREDDELSERRRICVGCVQIYGANLSDREEEAETRKEEGDEEEDALAMMARWR